MTDSTALSIFGEETSTMPAFVSEDAGMGNENVGHEDMAIPQLKFLQAMSPEVEEVEGAKAGLIYNTVSEELFESIYVINIAYKKEWSVFKKRNMGGGMFGSFDSEEAAAAHVSTLDGNPNDYDINETAQHIVLPIDADGEASDPAVMYWNASKLSVSRKWNSQINQKGNNGPRFAMVWHLSTEKKKNRNGDSYYVPAIEFAAYAPENFYERAKEIYLSMKN